MDINNVAIATYGKIADKYSNQYFNDLTDSPYIDKFLEKLPKVAKVLDVGSGPGQFSQYMAQKGFEVTGIDYSKEMLELAKQNVPNIQFLYMDMRNLEFKEASFEGVLAAYSLIHIASGELLATLKGFYKVLKPQGFLEIIAQKGEPDQIIDEPFMPSEKMFFNFFTKERLTNYLEDAGFQITYQLETDSQDPDSVSDKIIYTIAQKT